MFPSCFALLLLNVAETYISLDHSSPNLIQAPDYLNVNNSLQLVNNVVSPINEDLNIQFTPGICIGYSTIETKEAVRIEYNGFLFPHEYSGKHKAVT